MVVYSSAKAWQGRVAAKQKQRSKALRLAREQGEGISTRDQYVQSHTVKECGVWRPHCLAALQLDKAGW